MHEAPREVPSTGPTPLNRTTSNDSQSSDSSLVSPLHWAPHQQGQIRQGTPGMRRSRRRSLMNQVLDPRRWLHQNLLLLLVCSFIPGPYFFDTVLAAYKGPIKDIMGINNKEFSLLFALSSVTGVACGPFGALISKTGRTRWVMASGFMCMLGALFTVLGLEWKLYPVMLLARVLFWLSLYAVLLAQNMIVYSAFTEISVAFGYSMVIFAMRLGGVGGGFFSGILLQTFGVKGTLWFAWSLVLAAFLGTLLFGCLFRGTTTARDVRRLHPSGRAKAKSFELRLLRLVPRSSILFACSQACLYGSVFPFENIAVDMLRTNFNIDSVTAGMLLSCVPGLSLLAPLLTPLIGKTAMHQCKRAAVGLVLLACGHAVVATYRPWSPYIGFFMIGSGYVFSVCCLWTALPELVQSAVEHEHAKKVESLVLGLAYGALSIGQCFSNFITGVINDMTSYQLCSVWFALNALVGSISISLAVKWHVPLRPSSSDAPETAGTAGMDELQTLDEGHVVSNHCLDLCVDDNYVAS